MVDDAVLEDILKDYSKFTKEEYEVINTYVVKKEAEYETKRAERIANTDPQYLTRRKYIEKYGDLALRHKEIVLNNTLEHLNAHKEILLQCLSILNNLVSNPNFLDTLANVLDSDWYGGQDFKQFLANLIIEERNYIAQLWTDLMNYNKTPLLYFLPELFDNTTMSITDTADTQVQLNEMFRNNYPLIP